MPDEKAEPFDVERFRAWGRKILKRIDMLEAITRDLTKARHELEEAVQGSTQRDAYAKDLNRRLDSLVLDWERSLTRLHAAEARLGLRTNEGRTIWELIGGITEQVERLADRLENNE